MHQVLEKEYCGFYANRARPTAVCHSLAHHSIRCYCCMEPPYLICTHFVRLDGRPKCMEEFWTWTCQFSNTEHNCNWIEFGVSGGALWLAFAWVDYTKWTLVVGCYWNTFYYLFDYDFSQHCTKFMTRIAQFI